MPKKIKLKRNYIVIAAIGIFICFMIWLVYVLNSDMMQIDIPVDYNSGWQVDVRQENNTVVLNREISEEMLGKAICFYVYDSFVDASIDGKSIYHFGESHTFLHSPGTLWHMIEVPANDMGDSLTIEIVYAYDYKFTTDIDIMLGSSGGIILYLLRNEALDLIVNLVLMILGMVLCFIYFLELKNNVKNESSLYLGLLSLCFVFWTNNNLFFTQLIFPYGAGQYFAYYFFLFMLPLLLICYLETITKQLYFNYLYWSHLMLGFVLTVLQITGTAEFTETISVFLICSAVEMVIVIAKLFRNKNSYRNKLLVTAFVVLIISIIINAGLFLLSPTKGVSTTISKLGISFYLLVSIYDSLSNIITDLAEAKKSKVLRKIAFTDSLTGVGNRYAFNDEVNSIPLSELSVFSLDINNLKYYNDTFGHSCGDMLICEATKMLNKVFELLYRTGGDEFIAIKINGSPEELFFLKAKLGSLMEEYNGEEHDVTVEIACGYSAYQEGDISYEDILRRADSAMYQDKAALKKLSKIKSVR